MSHNKSVREELERRYGAECFIEKLHLRKDEKPRKYTSKRTNEKNEVINISSYKRKKKKAEKQL